MYEYKFEKLEFSKWKLTIPSLPDGSCRIKNGSIVKVNKLYYQNKFLNMLIISKIITSW